MFLITKNNEVVKELKNKTKKCFEIMHRNVRQEKTVRRIIGIWIRVKQRHYRFYLRKK